MKKKIITILFGLIGIFLIVKIWTPILDYKRYDLKIDRPNFKPDDCVSITITVKDAVTTHTYKIKSKTKYLYLLQMTHDNPMRTTEYEKITIVDEQYQKATCPEEK